MNNESVNPENANKPASERKLKTNRQNARKSTGPKTPQGKANSSFNALKHGLLARRVMFSDGKSEGTLHQLLADLREKYGTGDVRTELLLEGFVTEYWRRSQGLAHEINFLRNSDHFSSKAGTMPNLQRYMTASHHAMLKILDRLDQLSAAKGQPQMASTHPGDDSPAPQSGQQPKPTKPTNGRGKATQLRSSSGQRAIDNSNSQAVVTIADGSDPQEVA